jgi:glycine/D-amino acid oxidase-like deaminating enzyme
MAPAGEFDVAIIGGGIMGSATALNLVRGGMRTCIIERRGLCMEASGVNAGTLTHRTGPVSMQPYYTRSIALWKTTPQWLGADVGFKERGGLTVAFTEKEAERTRADFALRKQQEVEIELIDGNEARRLEPNLSGNAVLASSFPRDGYANSNQTGYAFHKALRASGAMILTNTEVHNIDAGDAGFTIFAGAQRIRARRIVLSSGAWVRQLLAMLDLKFKGTVTVRVNMMSVTERMPRLFTRIVTHANSGLTLKQPDNGTVLIGGGWQGHGNPRTHETEMNRDNIATNFRLTHSAFKGIEATRLVRSWFGFEARLSSDDPFAGALPGIPNAFAIGCFQSGWTAGPYIGKLMGELILGKESEMPLFDPARVIERGKPADDSAINDKLASPGVVEVQ